MTARAASWDIPCCDPSVPVVRVDGGGAALEGLAATVADAVGNVVVVGLWRGCVSVGAVATGDAKVASISGSQEKLKKYCGELGRVGTSKDPLLSLKSQVGSKGE